MLNHYNNSVSLVFSGVLPRTDAIKILGKVKFSIYQLDTLVKMYMLKNISDKT
jgi:hypothetical protein